MVRRGVSDGVKGRRRARPQAELRFVVNVVVGLGRVVWWGRGGWHVMCAGFFP